MGSSRSPLVVPKEHLVLPAWIRSLLATAVSWKKKAPLLKIFWLVFVSSVAGFPSHKAAAVARYQSPRAAKNIANVATGKRKKPFVQPQPKESLYAAPTA